MSENVNFYQGSKENYNPSEMQGGLYFSKDSKEILLNGESYGNAIPADEEDITAESGNLKLKDRAYDEANFSGKGYKILRKNIVEGKNILTQDMINEPNTIYEVRYDFDGNGQRLQLHPSSYLVYAGGSISNANIRTNTNSNYWLQGQTLIDYRLLGSNNVECRLGVVNIPSSDITLCLTALPGYLSKYNLVGDGITDNSQNFNQLLTDPIFQNIVRYKSVTLIFGRGYFSEHTSGTSDQNLTFLFKDTIKIGSTATTTILNLNLVIDGDIQFNWEDKEVPPTLDQLIQGQTAVTNYNCFEISVSGNITILVSRLRSNETPESLINHTINGGRETIPGTYYEGIKTNSGEIVYSSFSNNLLRVDTANFCRVIGGYWTNAYHGIITNTVEAIVEGVEVYDITGDNGITCSKSDNVLNGVSQYNTPGGVIIRNCFVRKCEDLGISIQNKVGIIDGCTVTECGNNNIADTQIYGINHSYNNGGGISVELALAYKENVSLIKPSVEIRNCSIYNCYNYAVSVDCSNVKIVRCFISNIVNTSKLEYETSRVSPDTGIQYNWSVRKRGIIGISPLKDYLSSGDIYVSGCVIDVSDNILWAQYTANWRGHFRNCYLKNYTSIPENKFSIRNADIIDCSLDNWDFTLEDQYNYHNCSINGRSSGTSEQRPQTAYVGFRYFDTDINCEIVWDGSQWVNTDGLDADSTGWALIE